MPALLLLLLLSLLLKSRKLFLSAVALYHLCEQAVGEAYFPEQFCVKAVCANKDPSQWKVPRLKPWLASKPTLAASQK
jgi:hypothetical protein